MTLREGACLYVCMNELRVCYVLLCACVRVCVCVCVCVCVRVRVRALSACLYTNQLYETHKQRNITERQ